MNRKSVGFAIALGLACTSAVPAGAETFNIPGGTLSSALDAYSAQSGVPVAIATQSLGGVRSNGVTGDMTADQALVRILSGTGFAVRHVGDTIAIVRSGAVRSENIPDEIGGIKLAAAQAAPAALETVTVTSSKIGGDVQNIPISITALSQEQLTATQTAGGPDLIKQVPNMTFTKTNFSGYSIQLRGIGTQAISVTTDPAVAVAFNDMPFIRNHFFEQEFYDVSQVEVLRGPQGTLYGRNATAGVVNLVSAKPSDQFEAMASVDIGNFGNRRFEGMINIPLVDDRFDLRIAGEWTKRNGYTQDTTLNTAVDGRDLWSGRLTLAWKPLSDLQTYFVWEHFSEDDDRLRSSKQLCKTAPPVTSVNDIHGVPVHVPTAVESGDSTEGLALSLNQSYTSQSCEATSLYSPSAFEVPYGPSLPYVIALQVQGLQNEGIDPYAETTQSQNLRNIQSSILPQYKAKNDTLEFNAEYTINPALTFTSQTGFGQDFLWSTEDYNRFDTSPGIFQPSSLRLTLPWGFSPNPETGTLMFCDPQLGCSDRLVAEDLSNEHAWQLSQEFRLASNFSGPLNFSAGGNYLHYETEENYYVFINALTAYSVGSGPSGTQYGGNGTPSCLLFNSRFTGGYQSPNPNAGNSVPLFSCVYYDPNPIGSLNNKGHNYFLSQNPYVLNSYAGFGEANYKILDDLKLTAGLRWTDDQKHFVNIPSEVITEGYGYFVTGAENQEWDRFTGRAVLDWTPKLDFTDQSLFYASYAHGYKAGGANPPGAIYNEYASANIPFIVHPLTFKPEYIEAFELGTKNTLLDGGLTINGDIFYYNYANYQISEIVDRTAINNNYDAHVEGAEIESNWEPAPGLRFNFAGGWERTQVASGTFGIDLMDRTAGMPGWMIVKPFPTQSSNCIVPDYVVAAALEEQTTPGNNYGPNNGICQLAYLDHVDPVTGKPYVPNPTGLTTCPGHQLCGSGPIPDGYPGFDPDTPAYNDGEGFAKNLSGNELPNAPPLTVSVGAQYTLPLTSDWAGTARADYYWQDYSWARIFNDNPYDRLRGYTNVNLTLIFTNQGGWQVMLYDKNVFNTTAITGDFLNSDDSGLTTNVFLTDPKLIGIRVTKNW